MVDKTMFEVIIALLVILNLLLLLKYIITARYGKQLMAENESCTDSMKDMNEKYNDLDQSYDSLNNQYLATLDAIGKLQNIIEHTATIIENLDLEMNRKNEQIHSLTNQLNLGRYQ